MVFERHLYFYSSLFNVKWNKREEYKNYLLHQKKDTYETAKKVSSILYIVRVVNRCLWQLNTSDITCAT